MASTAGANAGRRPNFLIFATDQLRADHLGCYGNPDVRTPHIDRLAARGVRFTESYVANPVCMPNRASLFTGRYPKSHGLRENGITLSRDETVLPEILRQAGYRTAAFGKLHLAPFGAGGNPDQPPADHELLEDRRYWEEHDEMPLPYYGFEEVYFVGGHGHYVFGQYKNELNREHPAAFELLQQESALAPPTGAPESWKAALPPELHYNTAIADRTIAYLENHPPDQPFFLWCSFPDPHHPYSPPRPYCDEYDPATIQFSPARREGEHDDLPAYVRACYEGRAVVGWRYDLRQVTDAHLREILALTYGMVSMVDHQVGRVLAALETVGLREDTVVIFLSDHGDLMGDHWLLQKGPFLYRGLVRVPLIWSDPALSRAGATSRALVSAVDLAPTVVARAAVPTPAPGRLALEGIPWPDIPQRGGVQGRSLLPTLQGETRSVRDWVYIEYDNSNLGDRLRSIRSHEWSLTYLVERDTGFLFDLRRDPDELFNRWGHLEYQGIRADLLAHLLRETARADDWLPPRKALA